MWVANLSVEEPDALMCARPGLWEPWVGNCPGPPGPPHETKSPTNGLFLVKLAIVLRGVGQIPRRTLAFCQIWAFATPDAGCVPVVSTF